MGDAAERELIERAQNGDVSAFEHLIAAEKARLYSFALGMAGGNHADAGDVLQEAFVKAFLNIRRFRGDSSFGTWLWRIVRNEFLNYRKNLSTRPLSDGTTETSPLADESTPDPVDDTIAEEQKRRLLELIALLPPKYREVLVMIDLREQEYEETAAMLGISMSTLKTRLMRAREKLSLLVRRRSHYFYEKGATAHEHL